MGLAVEKAGHSERLGANRIKTGLAVEKAGQSERLGANRIKTALALEGAGQSEVKGVESAWGEGSKVKGMGPSLG